MTKPVDAVLFDMGGTLRYRVKDPEARARALAELCRVLQYDGDPEELSSLLKDRASAYKAWSVETLTEAPEVEIWSKWMLPDYPKDAVRAKALELEHIWRATQGRRVARSFRRRGPETGRRAVAPGP